ncbi:DUF1461 domain-containing protein [Thermoleophilum album]|uniref:lipoprotein intramolecular transacylase Lit n=1 Tax=Thermoleophilum album TaxID=29539 RepID=UPI00237C6FDE|nr:DUF1461 domain-containing protein [Thermoleophilum album]
MTLVACTAAVLTLAPPLMLVNPVASELLRDLFAPELVGVTEAEADRTSRAIVASIYGGELAVDDPRPGYGAITAEEVAHMRDVRRAVLALWALVGGSLVLACFAWVRLRLSPRRRLRALRTAAFASLVFVALAVAFALLDFAAAFAGFHALLFPQGGWQFPAGKLLVELYPERFWRGAGAIAAALTVLSSATAVAITRPSRWLQVPGGAQRSADG